MKVRLMGLALVAVLGLAACSDDDGPTEIVTGRVRAVHLSPDAPAVDVLLDGTEVLSGVTYLISSEYLDVPTGDRTFRVEPTGTNTAVIEATVPVGEDIDYTLLAVNTVENIEPLYLTDDNTAPAPGQARIRVLHGAPSVGNVDVYVTAPGAALGTPTLTNVPFKGASGYLAVPAGRYQVRVTPTGVPGTVAINQEINAPANVVATAIAVERQGGGAPFSIAVLVDAAF
jgi:hypothetical protein